jgi:hypothetical protein
MGNEGLCARLQSGVVVMVSVFALVVQELQLLSTFAIHCLQVQMKFE